MAPELWKIVTEDGQTAAELTDGTLYEVRVTVQDGGSFDLSEAERAIKIAVVLGK